MEKKLYKFACALYWGALLFGAVAMITGAIFTIINL